MLLKDSIAKVIKGTEVKEIFVYDVFHDLIADFVKPKLDASKLPIEEHLKELVPQYLHGYLNQKVSSCTIMVHPETKVKYAEIIIR